MEIYQGHLRSFSSATGYGFVHNEQLQQQYGRDVYVHASLLPAGILCGAKVLFTIGVNERGQPQCRQVWEEDTSELDENAIFELLSVPFDLEPATEPETEVSPEETVRVLSWNILAPSYCNGAYFKDVHPEALRWSRRAWQIKALLFSLCPDIICLQEVEGFRVQDLDLCSYHMEYLQRPAGLKGARLDGCLVAWRADRFRMLRKHQVLYDDHLAEGHNEGDRGHSGHVALLVELLSLEKPTQPLLVATTHLAWGEDAEELRLKQAKILLQAVESWGHAAHSAVLCGDFNCIPDSDTYNLLSQQFQSAYRELENEPEMCTATNANVGFAEIIDYCFLWDRGALRRLWRPPSKDALRKLRDDNATVRGASGADAVPTLLHGGKWPSDHFPVVVDLVLTAQSLQ